MRSSQYVTGKFVLQIFHCNFNSAGIHKAYHLFIPFIPAFLQRADYLFQFRRNFLKSKSKKVTFTVRAFDVQFYSADERNAVFFCFKFSFFKTVYSVMICYCDDFYIFVRRFFNKLGRCILSVRKKCVYMQIYHRKTIAQKKYL